MNRKVKKGVYKQIQKFAELTKIMIVNGNMSRAKKCFAIAEKLFPNALKREYFKQINAF